ncbi:Hypothetical predicted protein [Pelobates cultripes]|uniref:Uncharacterized protein n=1 Tax=Pelobates cultripes TaxID=61616 RepID=A0AAD1VUN5_PELCU|nr:Hypothetical predicted protein [Pelobates cultripes]
MGKDQDQNKMRVSRKTEECNQSAKRPSAREEDRRARKAIHRSKPDSYKTSSKDDSSSNSKDEKSDSASNNSSVSEAPELLSKSDEENIIMVVNVKPLFDPDHIKYQAARN